MSAAGLSAAHAIQHGHASSEVIAVMVFGIAVVLILVLVGALWHGDRR